MKTIEIYGDIDQLSFDRLNYELKEANGCDVLIKVNSGGGYTYDGFGMAALIREYKGSTTTLGLGIVASAATVVLLAGDNVLLEKDCMFMIHNAWTYADGDSKALMKQSELVDKISVMIVDYYMNKLTESKSKVTEEELREMMDAETWLTAKEAMDLGFINNIRKLKEKPTAMAVMASINKFNYKNSQNMKNAEKLNLLTSFLNLFSATDKPEIKALVEEAKEEEGKEEAKTEEEEDVKAEMSVEELEALAAEMGFKLVPMEEEEAEEAEEETPEEAEEKIDVVAELRAELKAQAAKISDLQEGTISTAASDTPKGKKVNNKLSKESLEAFNRAAGMIAKFNR